VIRDQVLIGGESAGIKKHSAAFCRGFSRAWWAATLAGSGRLVLIIPIFTPTAPNSVRIANYMDAIYFIDPSHFSVEIRHDERYVFGAE
jgi:hypothetical protein